MRIGKYDHSLSASTRQVIGDRGGRGRSRGASSELVSAVCAGVVDGYTWEEAMSGTDAHLGTVASRVSELTSACEREIRHNFGVGASLGIRLEAADDGYARYYLDPTPATVNAMLAVHGGVLATLMDTAMGGAVFTKLGDGMAYTTLELQVNFIRSVMLDGSRLTCEANAVLVGRRTAIAECRITDVTGQLIANGSTTILVLHPQ
ncbi:MULTISPECIES: PaaI family thioesterase [Nocardia]|uniref:PaaI family thioesterase n=1 Tax=Nocardia abscessus TaxID=120957 RepID=UPI001E5E149B|nr:PaaI family thioesterase [Nocardia abscessus]